MERKRNFVVIGLGTFGSTVASELAKFDNRVLGIDIQETRVNRLAEDLTEAMIADGRDEEALRQAGVANYDVAIVAIGEDLEANILCTMNVRLLGVKTVWVKALTRTHHRILLKLGADRIIQPEQEIGQHIALMLHNPVVKDYVGLGNGFYVVNVSIPEQYAGKTLASLNAEESFELRHLGIMRGTSFISTANDDLLLEQDDRLLVLGRRQNLLRFGSNL
ncbi:MAG: TrkA family potassium uptake protein [Hyphomicrobiales bacterium]|nr:TrkA family potassium uptake protein [Hyphomicrobiales bacterium]